MATVTAAAARFAASIALACFLSLINHAERLPVKTYSVADGLLRDNVTRIRQDSRGFLWLCTAEGISLFDGSEFRNFTTDDGLPDRHVNDVLETRNGNYLIATDAGLARLDPRGLRGDRANPLFSVLSLADSGSPDVHVLLEDDGGRVWVGTDDGLFRSLVESDTVAFERVPLPAAANEPTRFNIRTIFQDSDRIVWVGTDTHGLFRIVGDGRIERYPIGVVAMEQDRQGRLWAAMSVDVVGLSLLDPKPVEGKNIVLRRYGRKDGFAIDRVLSIHQAKDGRLWVGTVGGLCLWQVDMPAGQICKPYVAANGLCDLEVWTITEDRDGNLWVGTRCGAKKITKFGFTSYFRADGLAFDTANSIFENRNGDLFVSFNVSKRPLSRFDGERFTPVEPNLPGSIGYGWGWKQTVLQDRVGEWWFPTKQGIYRFSGQSFETLGRAKPEKVPFREQDVEIFRIFEDSRGDVWIATTEPNELWRWERTVNRWRNFSADAGVSLQRLITAFTEDAAGNLWIVGSLDDAALIRYRDGKFRIFSQTEGMPKGWTRDLMFDRAGALWLANGTVGLLRVNDPNLDRLDFTRYTTADGLASNGIYCVTADEFGRIYAGSGRGVDRLDPATGQVENLTIADGLPDSSVEVAYRDRHNALWFATSNGLARFVPEPERTRVPPVILITGLRAAGHARPISILGEIEVPSFDLTPTENQIGVDFVGLAANLSEKLRFEYRLGDAPWTPTTERTLNFANLGAGDYRFEVRAVTSHKVYSRTPASISFRIAAPVWQRWWFIAGLVLLTALVIYSLYRYRLRQLVEIERTRTRIATDLHDDIGSNLSKISLLSEIVKLQPAPNARERERLLDSIAAISRESTQSMSDIVWAISPRRDSMLELTRRMRGHAEEVFVDRGVQLSFHVPPDGARLKLSMNTRRELYLIFKEAVNNIVKHSACKQCEIDLRIVDQEISLEVRDDGRGFDMARGTDGNGLENMRNRAVAAGGKLDVASEVDRGTTVNVRFPLQ